MSSTLEAVMLVGPTNVAETAQRFAALTEPGRKRSPSDVERARTAFLTSARQALDTSRTFPTAVPGHRREQWEGADRAAPDLYVRRMADIRHLWWNAGRMAFRVATNDDDWRNERWSESLHRSATVLEPVWPNDSAGDFSYALPTVGLLLYAGPLKGVPEDVPVEEIIPLLASRRAEQAAPSLEDVIREGLTVREHDLDDDSQLSSLVRYLTARRRPVTHTSAGHELPASEQMSGGTLMDAGACWAHFMLAQHYLRGSA